MYARSDIASNMLGLLIIFSWPVHFFFFKIYIVQVDLAVHFCMNVYESP